MLHFSLAESKQLMKKKKKSLKIPGYISEQDELQMYYLKQDMISGRMFRRWRDNFYFICLLIIMFTSTYFILKVC